MGGFDLKNASSGLGARFNVSPIKNIREARNRLDYFAAFALAVAYIEHYIFMDLRKGLDEKEINKLKGRHTNQLVKQLLYEDEEREELYANLKKIIKERNAHVHPKDRIYNKYEYDQNKESLLDVAIDCINELMK